VFSDGPLDGPLIGPGQVDAQVLRDREELRIGHLVHRVRAQVSRDLDARLDRWIGLGDQPQCGARSLRIVGFRAQCRADCAPILDAFERYGREGTAGMVGVPARTLFRLLTDSQAITFEIADRIVTGIEGAAWWRDDPERLGWYFGHDAKLRP
jgi:hypothetical protein